MVWENLWAHVWQLTKKGEKSYMLNFTLDSSKHSCGLYRTISYSTVWYLAFYFRVSFVFSLLISKCWITITVFHFSIPMCTSTHQPLITKPVMNGMRFRQHTTVLCRGNTDICFSVMPYFVIMIFTFGHCVLHVLVMLQVISLAETLEK